MVYTGGERRAIWINPVDPPPREDSLARSEARFRDLVENTSDWIWEVDSSLRYVHTSPKVTEVLGYEPAEVPGKTPFDFMPPEEVARLQPAVQDLQRNPRHFRTGAGRATGASTATSPPARKRSASANA